MSTRLSIRRATGADLDDVLILLQRCIAAMQGAGIDQWDEIYPTRETFLADVRGDALYEAFEPDGHLAGVIVLNEEQNPEYSEVPWTIESARVGVVHRLMVDPSRQGGGIARALMAFAEARALELGYDTIRLDAFTANPRALRLYPGLGYRDAGGVTFRKGAFRCFEKKLTL